MALKSFLGDIQYTCVVLEKFTDKKVRENNAKTHLKTSLKFFFRDVQYTILYTIYNIQFQSEIVCLNRVYT